MAQKHGTTICEPSFKAWCGWGQSLHQGQIAIIQDNTWDPKNRLNYVVYSDTVAAVQLLSYVQLFATPWMVARQTSLSITIYWSCSNSCLLSQWCYLTISSSATLFSCLQSFPASGSFPMSWLFASGGESIGSSASASTSAVPMNIQGSFPLGLTGLISLLSKGLSRVFFSTTVQKHQFPGIQSSLWSNSHIRLWLLVENMMLSEISQSQREKCYLFPLHEILSQVHSDRKKNGGCQVLRVEGNEEQRVQWSGLLLGKMKKC